MNMKKSRFVTILFFGILILCIVFCILTVSFIYPRKAPDTDIRTDAEAITRRFPFFSEEDILWVRWKAEDIAVGGIGPSSYRIKGIIKVDAECAKRIENLYDFQPAAITVEDEFFPEEGAPFAYKWGYNETLSYTDITQSRFVGSFYYDEKNDMFWFDCDSN